MISLHAREVNTARCAYGFRPARRSISDSPRSIVSSSLSAVLTAAGRRGAAPGGALSSGMLCSTASPSASADNVAC